MTHGSFRFEEKNNAAVYNCLSSVILAFKRYILFSSLKITSPLENITLKMCTML